MKFITTFAIRPGALRAAVKQYMAGMAAPAPGVTLHGRWHKIDMTGGFSLYETDDPEALYLTLSRWAELLDFTISPVVDDSVAAPMLIAQYKD